MSELEEQNSEDYNLEKFELEFLKQEYFFLQTTREDYNKQIWVIKALGITGTGAVVALAVQQNQAIISLIGCAIPLFFWILESQWKHFQRGFYPRIYKIESLLNGRHHLSCPSIFSDWSRTFRRDVEQHRKGYFWNGLLNPSVFISYILEIVFLFSLYKLNLIDSPVTPR